MSNPTNRLWYVLTEDNVCSGVLGTPFHQLEEAQAAAKNMLQTASHDRVYILDMVEVYTKEISVKRTVLEAVTMACKEETL